MKHSFGHRFQPFARLSQTKPGELAWAGGAAFSRPVLLAALLLAVLASGLAPHASDASMSAVESSITKRTAPGREVVFIEATDGMQVMADMLAGRADVQAVHAIVHANVGMFQLGNATVDGGSLSQYAEAFETIQGGVGLDFAPDECFLQNGPISPLNELVMFDSAVNGASMLAGVVGEQDVLDDEPCSGNIGGFAITSGAFFSNDVDLWTSLNGGNSHSVDNVTITGTRASDYTVEENNQLTADAWADQAGEDHVVARELAVFAPDTPDMDTLIAGLREGVTPYVLSGEGDAVAEIAARAEGYEAVHILSHGAPGRVFLGETVLSSETLGLHADALAALKTALGPDGELLLYGCGIAGGPEGEAFLTRLDSALGRPVAASTDLTGAAALGGDWELERGGVTPRLTVFRDKVQTSYEAVLQTFTWDTLSTDFSAPNPVQETVGGNTIRISASAGGSWAIWASDGSLPNDLRVEYGASIFTITFDSDGDNIFDDPFDLTSLQFTEVGGFPGEIVEFRPNGSAAGTETATTNGDAASYQTFIPATPSNFENLTSLEVRNAAGMNLLNGGFNTIVVSEASTNDAPTFNDGASTTLVVDEDSGATDIDALLDIDDSDSGDPWNWSVTTGPSNGSVGGFASETSSQSGTTVMPSGLTYTPIADYSGNDSFIVQITDGTDTDTITVNVTVQDAPEVTLIGPANSSPTNADTLDFNVTFSENVTGVDAGDFDISGASTANSIAVSGVGNTYSITVSGGDLAGFDGAVGLNLIDNETIVNGDNVALGGVGTSGAGDGSLTGATYTVDNTAPSAPSAPDMTVATDTGASSTDDVTSDTTPIFTGSGVVANETVTVISSVNGTLGTTTADGSGNWTFTPSAALSEGGHDITATTQDAAGNTSAPSTALSIVIDTTAPAAPGTPDLGAGSDTGASDSDDVTSDTIPTFAGTGAVANRTVEVTSSLDGVLGTATANGSGNWTLTPGSALSEGTHTITVTTRDLAGNVSSASAGLSVTIDTTAAAPSTLDLQAGSDTGISDTDDVTSDTTPTFTGTGENGATVTLFRDDNSNGVVDGGESLGTAVVAGSAWSITSSALTDGSYNIRSIQTDVAGNTSAASAILSTAIDTAAPAAPSTPELDAGSDTGASDTDNLTNDTTPTFGGTGENGETVTLFRDDNSDGVVDGGESLGTAVVAGGAWSITSSALTDGTYNIRALQTDTAGNASNASGMLSTTIETGAPTIAGAIAPSVATITDAQVGTGTFTLTIDFNEAMNTAVAATLSFPTGGEDPTAGGSLVNPSGAWTDSDSYVVTYDVTDQNAVIRDIDVRVENAQDAAGNTIAGTTQNDIFTVITAPAPEVDSITSTSGNGTFGVGDNVNVTVTFGEGVDFTANGGSLQATLSNGQTVTLANADATNQTAFGGTYTIQEGQSDSANLNVTLLSLTGGATLTANDDGLDAILAIPGGQNLADNEDIVVDANTPAAPPPDLTAATDTGTSDTDNLTSNAAPVITGTTEAGATVSVRVGGAQVGTATANGAGAWSYTFAAGQLSEGANAVDIIVSDAVNTSTDSPDMTITLDTGAPTLSAVDLVAASDTGTSNTDDITNDTTPTIAFLAESGAAVAIDWGDGNGFVADAAGTGGTQQVTLGTAYTTDGARTITVRATDAAGNQTTQTLSITVDTGAETPTLSPTTANTDPFTLTVDFGQTMTGFGAADVILGGIGGTVGAITDQGNGRYAVQVDPAADGTLTVDIAAGAAQDVAGNATLAPAQLSVLVDTTAPVLNSITRLSPLQEVTNADTLTFRASFDTDVQNVDVSDFAVNGSTTAVVSSVTVVTPDTAFDVTLSGGDLADFDGTVGLDLAPSQDILDLAGNALPSVEPPTDETYTLDNTGPELSSIVRQAPADETTNADTLTFRATFDMDVQNVDATDFVVTGSTATVTGVSTVSADTRSDRVRSGRYCRAV